MGLSDPPTAAPLYVKVWLGAEGGSEGKPLLKTRKNEKKKRKGNLSTITVLDQVQQNVSVSVFLQDLHSSTATGCRLTANSNCPEAKGSHLHTGSFIFPRKRKWSPAVILNHPPAAALQGHQGSPGVGGDGHVTSGRDRRTGTVRRRETDGTFPQPRWKRNGRFPALVLVGVPASTFKEEGGTHEDVAPRGVTKETAQAR